MKLKLQKLISIALLILFAYSFIETLMTIFIFNIPYYRYDILNKVSRLILFCGVGLALVIISIVSLKKGYKNVQFFLYCIFMIFGAFLMLFFDFYIIESTHLLVFALMIFEKTLPNEEDKSSNQQKGAEKVSVSTASATTKNVVKTDEVDNSITANDNKTIVKTKIIESHQEESASSKRKGKWATALTAGLTGSYMAMSAQQLHNRANASYDTIVTFLVIYSDGTRETVDTIKGDDRYNTYIMYVE